MESRFKHGVRSQTCSPESNMELNIELNLEFVVKHGVKRGIELEFKRVLKEKYFIIVFFSLRLSNTHLSLTLAHGFNISVVKIHNLSI